MSTAALVARGLLVLAVLLVALWCVRRTDGLRAVRRDAALQVLGSARVGKGATVTLVRIGDAEYALGVTDSAVSLLTRTGDAAAPEPVAQQAGPLLPAGVRAPSLRAVARRLAAPAPAAATTPAPSTDAAPGRRPRPASVSPSALGQRLGLALRARLVRDEQPATVPDFAAELAAASHRPPPALPRPRAALEDHRTELLDDVLLAVLAEPSAPAAAPAVVPAPVRALAAPSLQVAAPRAEAVPDSPVVDQTTRPVTDGSVTSPHRRAGAYTAARSAARMDAPGRQDEEHLWSRSCRQRRVRAQRALLDREACLR